MDWYFLVRDTNRAAEFWIVCNLWICPAGNPWRRLLQKSIWHITNAWTKCSAVCLSRNERTLPILWSANDADRHFCATKFFHCNVVDFRVMRRLCHREWNLQTKLTKREPHSWDPQQRTTWSRLVTSDFNSVYIRFLKTSFFQKGKKINTQMLGGPS